MGNSNDVPASKTKAARNSISKHIRSKLKRKGERSDSLSADEFIIQHAHRNKRNDRNLIANCLDPRRVVFVSLIGLYQSWKDCPSVVLYSALFILPLDRQWVYHPTKYHEELQTYFSTPTRSPLEDADSKEFMELLKWKDQQKLVFWMRGSATSTGDGPHPFWKELSLRLSTLHDTVSGDRYNALHLEEQWWRDLVVTKFDTKISSVLMELQSLTMRFDSIREILWQSNPKSLNPVIAFSVDGRDSSSQDPPSAVSFEICRMEPRDDEDHSHCDGRGGMWFIADDYDRNTEGTDDED